MIQNLSAGFSSELKTVQDKLDVMRAQIRAATRKLSEERKEIQAWQSQCTELDKIKQRIHNIEKALEDVDSFDWTGRSDLADNDAKSTAGPAFMWHGANSTMVGLDGSTNDPINWETDPPMPLSDSVQSLIKLKRLRMWQVRTEELFRERMKNSQGTSVEKEFQYKKIVALCTGKPVDQVEEVRLYFLPLLRVKFSESIHPLDLCSPDARRSHYRDGGRGPCNRCNQPHSEGTCESTLPIASPFSLPVFLT